MSINHINHEISNKLIRWHFYKRLTECTNKINKGNKHVNFIGDIIENEI